MKKLSVIIFILFIFQQCGFNQEGYCNYSVPIKDIIDSLNVDHQDIFVLIDKSEFKLALKTRSLVLKEYPVVFGGNPVDDKQMEGDQCTPEGIFKIRDKYPHKSWSKFIWIDYPNERSWVKFNEAKNKGTIPANAKIGGEIGIHGVPDTYEYAIDMKYNWTLGCISLKNEDINEIYNVVKTGTTVVIIK